jgi:ribonuclease BN (tRNA processing enzyme)
MEFPGGKNVVFISDNGPARDDSKLVDMAYGSDILIHDAQYLPKEFRDKRKFGHSPYNYALDIAFKARVRTLILFHHDPGRDDRGISRIENDAQQLAKKIGFRGAVFAAREGLELGC